MIGEKFGRLTVVRPAPSKHGRRFVCDCECGRAKVVNASNLRAGRVKSCGCKRVERAQTIKQLRWRYQRRLLGDGGKSAPVSAEEFDDWLANQ